jgi:hypothetical protein
MQGVTPLDPIASLAITIAEAPASCALFLGSGVSTDAGVPTGAQGLLDSGRRPLQGGGGRC